LTVYRQTVYLFISVIAVNVMSLLDAISTLLLLENDSYIEINPLMKALMECNYLQYFGLKMGITLIGTVIFWHYYEQRASARMALKSLLRVYSTLMIWQTLLLTGLFK
jgi:hypothetical protein